LDMAKQYNFETFGVEFNNSAAKVARGKGHKVLEKSEGIEEKYKGCFDLVCSFQVIEHIANPRDFIWDMVRLTKRSGKIVMSVPNQNSISLVDKEEGGVLNMPPHHQTRWNEEVFKRLEEIYPIKLVGVYKEPLQKYNTIGYVVGYFRNKIRNAGFSNLEFLANKITLWPIIVWIRRNGSKKIDGHTILALYEKD